MRFSREKAIVIDSVSVLRQKVKKVPFYAIPFCIFTVLCALLLFVDSWNRSLLPVGNVVASQEQIQSPDIPMEDADINAMFVSNDEQQSITPPKPLMHTFWESVPGGCCGANELGHKQLIDAWQDAWHSNGWETKILSMDDVRSHPDFDKMTQLFEGNYIHEYDKRCFYRWLAMGNEPGGGWISDYDTFPLHFTGDESYSIIEQNGSGLFTSYAHVAPALIYASKDEWNRVIQLMMETMPTNVFKGSLLTDMYVFKQLVEERRAEVGNIYEPGLFVNKLGFRMYGTDAHTLDCQELNHPKAIHFSHFSTGEAAKEGRFPIKEGGDSSQTRGLAAGRFMKDYSEQCVNDSSSTS